MPRVSVVIPTYNRASTISKAIDSALSQTLADIEVIVVDDGSVDGTDEVVSQIKDSRVRYLRQPNSGACVARNYGIKSSNSNVVALLDSDDVWLPEHLSGAYAAIKDYPCKVSYSRLIVNRGDGVTLTKPPRPLRCDEHISEYLLCDKGFIQTSTLVLHKDLALRTLFKEDLPFGQDTDFAIRLEANGADFYIQEHPTVIWSDEFDKSRISSSPRPEPREKWLAEVRHLITPRAYIADRGWHLAKCYRAHGRPIKAILLLIYAVIRNAYSGKHAFTVALQVLLPKSIYRKLADSVIKNGIK